MLFEYAYSNTLFSTLLDLSELLKTLTVAFGNIPPHTSLRHAICAVAAAYLPKEQFQGRLDYHKRLALRPLIYKIKTPATIVDADVFAAGILVYAICADGKVHNTDMLLVSKICMTMFRHLTENSTEQPLSDLLTVFGAAAVDFCSNRLLTLRAYPLSSSLPVIHSYRTSFRQRAKYYEEIGRTTSVPEAWQSYSVEASFDTVGRLLYLSLSCLCEIAAKEILNDFGKGEIVDLVLQSIEAELSDPDFLVAAIGGALTSPTCDMTVDGWLASYVFLGVGCLDLFKKLLRAPSILQGLDALEASPSSRNLIPWCGSERLHGFPIQYYNFIPLIRSLALVLGGCTLPKGEFPERKSLVMNYIDIVSVRSCITLELETMDRWQVRRSLEIFWETRSIENFAQILEMVWHDKFKQHED
jgi:hypothetical protein